MYCFDLDQCASGDRGACFVVHAGLDQIVSLENSERLAAFLDAELITITGSGHTLMSEAPGEFAALLTRLAAEVGDSRLRPSHSVIQGEPPRQPACDEPTL